MANTNNGRYSNENRSPDHQRNTDYPGAGQSGYQSGRGDFQSGRDYHASQTGRDYEDVYDQDRRYRESQPDRGDYDRNRGSGGGGDYQSRDSEQSYGSRGSYGGRARMADDDSSYATDRDRQRSRFGMGSGMGMGGSQQQSRGLGHRGKGPQGWQRSDERIKDQLSELLADDDDVDASMIDISVKGGEVTLTGTVVDRQMKRRAEAILEHASGVKDVQNQLRIKSHDEASRGEVGERQGQSKSRPS